MDACANKVARNADVLPEVASDPVAEYLRLKGGDCESLDSSENVRVDWKTAAVSSKSENVAIYVWQRHMVIGVTKILLRFVW